MFSKIISVICGVVFIAAVSALDEKEKSAYAAAFACTKAGWDVDIGELQAKGERATEADKIKEGCLFFRVSISTCLTSKGVFAIRQVDHK